MTQLYAFFDLDGTLIRETSLLSFLALRFMHEDPALAPARMQALRQEAQTLQVQGATREELNTIYYRRYYAGANIAELSQLAERWFEVRRADAGFWKQEVVARLEQHQRDGVLPVLVTGSFRELAQVVAAALGIAHSLCAPLAEHAGCYTGELTAAPTIGAGKVQAVERFLADQGDSLQRCFAYADDESDIPLLSRVGRPHVVATSSPELLSHAAQCGWPVVA
jgi:HAD superfamily hydrolase (TIGR01490 family)